MKLRKLARLCEHDELKAHPFVKGVTNLHGTEVAAFVECPGGVLLPDDTLEALRAELLNQWDYNHFEYCGRTWPHPEGAFCGWPQPEVLKRLDALSESS